MGHDPLKGVGRATGGVGLYGLRQLTKPSGAPRDPILPGSSSQLQDANNPLKPQRRSVSDTVLTRG